jgi:hypothetical protein
MQYSMRLYLLIIYLLAVSCSQQKTNTEAQEHIIEYDSSFWQATELVWNRDTIPLDLNHLFFNIQDTFVNKWFFRNDTLKNLTQRNFCKCWIESKDSITFPITCKNYWYPIGDEYTMDGDNGRINRVVILPGAERDSLSYQNQYALDSAYIVLRRKLITAGQASYLSELNTLNKDTVLVLH